MVRVGERSVPILPPSPSKEIRPEGVAPKQRGIVPGSMASCWPGVALLVVIGAVAGACAGGASTLTHSGRLGFIAGTGDGSGLSVCPGRGKCLAVPPPASWPERRLRIEGAAWLQGDRVVAVVSQPKDPTCKKDCAIERRLSVVRIGVAGASPVADAVPKPPNPSAMDGSQAVGAAGSMAPPSAEAAGSPPPAAGSPAGPRMKPAWRPDLKSADLSLGDGGCADRPLEGEGPVTAVVVDRERRLVYVAFGGILGDGKRPAVAPAVVAALLDEPEAKLCPKDKPRAIALPYRFDLIHGAAVDRREGALLMAASESPARPGDRNRPPPRLYLWQPGSDTASRTEPLDAGAYAAFEPTPDSSGASRTVMWLDGAGRALLRLRGDGRIVMVPWARPEDAAGGPPKDGSGGSDASSGGGVGGAGGGSGGAGGVPSGGGFDPNDIPAP